MTGFFTRDSYSFNWNYVRQYTPLYTAIHHYTPLYTTIHPLYTELSLVDSV